jgi:ribonuclease BN (tRNA processing enzyme)
MSLFPLNLKAGFITHAHADHILGLPSLAVFQSFYGGRRIKVFIPEFARDLVEKLTHFIPEEYKKGVSFNFFNPSTSSIIYYDEEVEVCPVWAFHTVPAVSYSIYLKGKKLQIFTQEIRPLQ